MFDQPKPRVSASSAQCSVDKEAVKTDKITRQQAAINRYSSPPTSFEYVDESPPTHHAGGDAKVDPLRICDEDEDTPRICITNTISDSGERNRIIGGIEKNNNEIEQNKIPKTKSAPQLAFLLKKAFSTKVEISDDCLEGATSSFPKTSITEDGLVQLDRGINANINKSGGSNRDTPCAKTFMQCYSTNLKGNTCVSTTSANKTGANLNLSCYVNTNQDSDSTPYESLQNSAHSDIIHTHYSDNKECGSKSVKDNNSKMESFTDFPFLQTQKILEPFKDSYSDIPLNLDHNEDIVQVHSSYNKCSNKIGNGSNLPIPRPSFHNSRNSSLSEADCESYKTCSQGSLWSINIDNNSHVNTSSDSIEAKALLKKFTELCPTVPNTDGANAESASLHGHVSRGDSIVNLDDITQAGGSLKDIPNDSSLNCQNDWFNTRTNSNVCSHGKGCRNDDSKNNVGDNHTPCVPIVQVHSPSPSISLKSTDSILSKRTSEESLIKSTNKLLTNQNKTNLPDISIKMKTESVGNGPNNGGPELCKYVTITLGNEKKTQNYCKSEGTEVYKLPSTHSKVCWETQADITGQKSKSDTLLHRVMSQDKYDSSNSSKGVVNSKNVKELQRVKSDSRLNSFINLGFSSGVDIGSNEC